MALDRLLDLFYRRLFMFQFYFFLFQ